MAEDDLEIIDEALENLGLGELPAGGVGERGGEGNAESVLLVGVGVGHRRRQRHPVERHLGHVAHPVRHGDADEIEQSLKPQAAVAGVQALPTTAYDLPLREAREQFEREYLVYKLKEAGGSVGKLAEAVGMERTHLYRKLRALGVDPRTAATTGEARK